MKKVLFLFSLAFLFMSCDTSKKTDHSSEKQAGQTTFRFIASFISKGSGIDKNSMNAMTTYIKEYETANKISISFEKVPWGKEGEMDYCFSLKELKSDKQVDFIKGFKDKVGNNGQVLYQENAVCKYKK